MLRRRGAYVNRPDRGLIFDMDGVLIDSEPFWRRVERRVFGEVGVVLTEADCFETQGLRIDEVAEHWFARSPWSGPSIEAVAERIVEGMVETIRAEGVPMPGATEAIREAQARGWRLGLASSSSLRLIETVLQRFDLRDAFESVHSAEFEAQGKPAPDVYLSALRSLGLEGQDCVAIEDSANGVDAALAAGMRCVAIPDAESRGHPRFNVAHWRFDSLHDFTHALDTLENERESGRKSTQRTGGL